ncbi:hypothetical protein ABFA07_011019 [Porites harrisoni]
MGIIPTISIVLLGNVRGHMRRPIESITDAPLTWYKVAYPGKQETIPLGWLNIKAFPVVCGRRSFSSQGLPTAFFAASAGV